MQFSILLLLLATTANVGAVNYCAACVDGILISMRHFMPHVIVPEGWPQCDYFSSKDYTPYAVECDDACVTVDYTYGGLGLTHRRMLHCATDLMPHFNNKSDEVQFPVGMVQIKGRVKVYTCFGNLCNYNPNELRPLVYCSNGLTANNSALPKCPAISVPEDIYPNPPYFPRLLIGEAGLMSLYTVVISMLLKA